MAARACVRDCKSETAVNTASSASETDWIKNITCRDDLGWKQKKRTTRTRRVGVLGCLLLSAMKTKAERACVRRRAEIVNNIKLNVSAVTQRAEDVRDRLQRTVKYANTALCAL